jgi:transposase-like protein
MSKQEISKKIRTRRRATTTDTASGDDAGLSDERDPDERDAEAPVPEDLDAAPSSIAPSRASKSPATTTETLPPGRSPSEAKLRLVLLMMLQGRTQKEIAAHFRVDPRTIRNWQKKLDGVTLGIVENLDPGRELERILVCLAASEAQLRKTSEEAQARSDFATVIRCAKELARLAVQRLALLQKLGVFDRFNVPSSGGDEPGQRQADVLSEMIESFTASFADGPGEPSDPAD